MSTVWCWGRLTGARLRGFHFDFIAPVDGAYPFRLLWWEGGGGSNVELFMVDLLTNQKILINDLTAAVPIRGYRGNQRDLPGCDQGASRRGIEPERCRRPSVVVEITDGTVPVDASPLTLTVNGTAVTGATKTGAITMIKRTGSLASLLPATQQRHVGLCYHQWRPASVDHQYVELYRRWHHGWPGRGGRKSTHGSGESYADILRHHPRG